MYNAILFMYKTHYNMAYIKEYTFRQFMQLAFSEKGRPSSKRVIGGLLVVGVIISTIISVCVGHTMFLESILNTSLIVGAALLGLSSVTSIWKNDGSGSVSAGDTIKKEGEFEDHLET